MLRSGALVPGERLKEFDLAQRLQVNRSVAREALRTLEYAGLVRIVPNRGAELRKLSMEEALNLYDLRAGLARAAARSAALRAERAEVKQLQELQNAGRRRARYRRCASLQPDQHVIPQLDLHGGAQSPPEDHERGGG